MDFFPDEDLHHDENNLHDKIDKLEDKIKKNDDLRDDEDVKYQSLQLRKAYYENYPNHIIEKYINDLEVAIEGVLEEKKDRRKRRKTAGKKLRKKTKKRKTKKRKTKKSKNLKGAQGKRVLAPDMYESDRIKTQIYLDNNTINNTHEYHPTANQTGFSRRRTPNNIYSSNNTISKTKKKIFQDLEN